MADRKKVLVLGCGSIGRRHIRLLNERSDVDLAACDLDASVAPDVRGLAVDAAFFDSVDAALAWGPQFVVVATPNRFHCDNAIAALEAGAHVLCEKPLADTVAAGRRMVEAAEAHGRVLAVGYSERYRTSIQHIESMIKKGELGNLVGGRAMVGTYNTLLCARTGRPDFGSILVDYTHEFDFLRAFFGEVKRLECFANDLGQKEKKGSPAVAVTLLEYESGAVVSVHMDYVQHPQRRSVEVYGDRRTVELDLHTNVMKIFDCDEEGFHALVFDDIRDDRFRAEHEDLFEAAATGRPPRVDGPAALKALEVAERAIERIRAQEGRR